MGKLISTLLFQPPAEPTYISSKKYFWLTTSKGSKIPAFFVQQNHARFTILYSHGNAEDLGMIYEYLAELSDLLYVNILAYDYSGYGMAKRRKDNIAKNIEPSEENCNADIEAAMDHLIRKEGIDFSQIVFYGRSVGSGPSCYLAQKLNAAENPIAGMILHSPFLSVCRVVLDMGVEMTYDVFPNVSRIKDVGCPTFIIHGTNDEIVPFKHGKGLYEALPERIAYPPFWAENMGHNNIEIQMTSVFIKRLQKFFFYLRKKGKGKGKGKSLQLGGGGVRSLEKDYGISFSTDSGDHVTVTDSSDDESLGIERYVIPSIASHVEFDGSLAAGKTSKLQSAATLNRIASPISRDEMENLVRRSQP